MKATKKDRLSANDIIQVKKIIEHIYEKILGRNEFAVNCTSNCSNNGTTNCNTTNNGQRTTCNCRQTNCTNYNSTSSSDPGGVTGSTSSNDDDLNKRSIAEEKLELICQDQVLDVNMDLRTVKHFIWKSGSELEIFYKRIDDGNRK